MQRYVWTAEIALPDRFIDLSRLISTLDLLVATEVEVERGQLVSSIVRRADSADADA